MTRSRESERQLTGFEGKAGGLPAIEVHSSLASRVRSQFGVWGLVMPLGPDAVPFEAAAFLAARGGESFVEMSFIEFHDIARLVRLVHGAWGESSSAYAAREWATDLGHLLRPDFEAIHDLHKDGQRTDVYVDAVQKRLAKGWPPCLCGYQFWMKAYRGGQSFLKVLAQTPPVVACGIARKLQRREVVTLSEALLGIGVFSGAKSAKYPLLRPPLSLWYRGDLAGVTYRCGPDSAPSAQTPWILVAAEPYYRASALDPPEVIRHVIELVQQNDVAGLAAWMVRRVAASL